MARARQHGQFWDSVLGRPGLKIPEPDAPEFVARARAHIAEADQRAYEAAGIPQPEHKATGVTTAVWDRDSVIAAIQTWARKKGVYPTSTEWQRRNGDDYPTYNDVRKYFDSWHDLIAAAGCPPHISRFDARITPDGHIYTLNGDYPIAVQPPPAEPTPPAAAPISEQLTIAEVAEQLEAALQHYLAADQALGEARDRFLNHPVIHQLCEYGLLDPSDFDQRAPAST